MLRRLLLLAACASLLTACGSSGKHPTSQETTTGATAATTTTTATTGVAATRTVETFFFRRNALTGVPTRVDDTPAVATSALNALLAGPPAGYTTAIPSDATLRSVSIVGGTATASFDSSLGSPTRSAQGQIVTTLTQFPTVRRVSIVAGGSAVTLRNGEGRPLPNGATAADYVDLTPDALIFVSTPARDSTVTSPVRVAGTSDTFEATFQLEVHAAGKPVQTKIVTATAGSGTRGRWSVTLALPAGDVTLVLYEASAEDGSHLHTTEVPLHVQ